MYLVYVKHQDHYTGIRFAGGRGEVPYKYEAFNVNTSDATNSILFWCPTEANAAAFAAYLAAENPKATIYITKAITAYKSTRPEVVKLSVSEQGELPA